MSRIAYVNGRYLPQSEASVNVEDRGYQFADGVYEVLYVSSGRFLDEDLHMTRLERSLNEISITPPMGRAALRQVLLEVTRRNRLRDGLVYMQVSRGVARRDHAFPAQPIPPARKLGRIGDHRAGPALGALRHQIHRPAAQRACQAGRPAGRSDRGDPDRP
jgi:D-alanine transaminase